MLTNITLEATQRTNRFSQSSPYGPCTPAELASGGSRGQSPISATAYAELTIPTAFTPYAPAASIPRYQHQQPVSGQRSSQHHLEATYQQQPQHPQHETYQSAAPSVYHSKHPTPSPASVSPLPHLTAMATTAPVYGPSSVSPYQLFVDVVSGATLSIDDDEAMMQCSGYMSPLMPDVTVGSPNYPYSQPAVGAYHDASERVGPSSVDPTTERCPCVYCLPVPQEKEEVRPEVPLKVQQTQKLPPVVAPVVSVGTQPQPTPAAKAATPKAPAAAKATVATTPLAAAPSKTLAVAATVYTVEVVGHHRRPQTVVSHIPLEEGAHVVFEGDRGIDMAVVASVHPSTAKGSIASGTAMVVRSATKEEIQLWTIELPQLAADAAAECATLVQTMRLKMAVRGASYQLDKQKLTFFYETSEHRVDFRKLLIELFNRYRCRIWMEKAIPEANK